MLPLPAKIKQRYISPEELAHQKQVDHDKKLRQQIWFQRAHTKLKPLSGDYYAQTLGESGFSGRNPQDALKALAIQQGQRRAQVNYNRLDAIERLEKMGRSLEADQLRRVHKSELIK